MSFALSPRRTDRHPVGLLIVVGLHVVLAAALLSARLQHAPTIEKFIPLTPLPDPVRPLARPQDPPPPPPHVLPRQVVVVPDDFKTDEPPPRDVVAAQAEPHADPMPPGGSADLRPDDDTVHAARAQARPARLDAGAAQCRPGYPAAAQRAGATGSTRIRFTVDALGHIAGSQILHPSGPTREHRLMDQAAAAALSRCPVQVGTDEQGRPLGTTTDVEYVWSLN